MRKALIISFVFSFLLSCNKSSDKDDFYTISGIVLDYDSRTPIQNANVICPPNHPESLLVDSVLSDVNGHFSFTYTKGDSRRNLYAKKNNYLATYFLRDLQLISNNDRVDTIYLSKVSYVNLLLHNSVIYNGNDSLYLTVFNNRRGYNTITGADVIGLNSIYNVKKLAATGDTILSNIPVVYFATPYNKVHMEYKIIRNGNTLFTQTDSTDLIQYSIKNHTINY